jgi:hypothetical protein
MGGLDVALGDGLRQRGRVDEILGMGRIQRAAAHGADLMSGAAQALQGRGDAGRRLDQHHLVELADVDPHLEGAGGDDGLELAGLEALLHGQADLACERAVVGPDEGRVRALVDLERELLGQAAAVGEEQRGAVGGDVLAKGGRERLPDLDAALGGVACIGWKPDVELDRLALGGRGDGHRSCAAPGVRPRHECRHGVERPHRGGERDALELAGQPRQALERGEQHRAAPVVHQRVHLVDDHRLDLGERDPAARGGQHQQEALRRGDEDLGRIPQQALPLALRRVAGAGLGADVGQGAERAQRAERLEEVAPDVVVERLERRNVEDAGASGRGRSGGERIQGPEKGGERLPAARGGRDQHVAAPRDQRPRGRLGGGRRAEGRFEPAAQGRFEARERVVLSSGSVHRAPAQVPGGRGRLLAAGCSRASRRRGADATVAM